MFELCCVKVSMTNSTFKSKTAASTVFLEFSFPKTVLFSVNIYIFLVTHVTSPHLGLFKSLRHLALNTIETYHLVSGQFNRTKFILSKDNRVPTITQNCVRSLFGRKNSLRPSRESWQPQKYQLLSFPWLSLMSWRKSNGTQTKKSHFQD